MMKPCILLMRDAQLSMIKRANDVFYQQCSRLLSTETTSVHNHVASILEGNQRDHETFHEKMIKVAIIGVPNSGKSTFINSMVDRRVCPASNKVHTTRGVSRAMCVEGDTQIVFLDTPGLVTPKEQKRHQLEVSFVNSFKSCMTSADVVGVIHDAGNAWTRDRLDNKVLRLLEKYHSVPSFLVLNKADLMKSKRKLLDLTRILTEDSLSNKIYGNVDDKNTILSKTETAFGEKKIRTGWPNFSNVFMVSSLTGDGLLHIKSYLTALSKPCSWQFSPAQHSDQPNEEVIIQTVRARLLDFMPQEIPYQLVTEMEHYHESDNGLITAVVLVTCPSPRIQRLVEGSGSGKLRQINHYVIADLRNAFYQPVNVTITCTSINTTIK